MWRSQEVVAADTRDLAWTRVWSQKPSCSDAQRKDSPQPTLSLKADSDWIMLSGLGAEGGGVVIDPVLPFSLRSAPTHSEY